MNSLQLLNKYSAPSRCHTIPEFSCMGTSLGKWYPECNEAV